MIFDEILKLIICIATTPHNHLPSNNLTTLHIVHWSHMVNVSQQTKKSHVMQAVCHPYGKCFYVNNMFTDWFRDCYRMMIKTNFYLNTCLKSLEETYLPRRAAWCISFFGMQPTFTHVPPRPIQETNVMKISLQTQSLWKHSPGVKSVVITDHTHKK